MIQKADSFMPKLTPLPAAMATPFAARARRQLPARVLHACLGVLSMLALQAGAVRPAGAQNNVTFLTFHCGDGTQFVAAFFKGDSRAHIQLDGKAMTLRHRLALSGTRYSAGDVSLRIRENSATLARGRQSTDCSSS
jgi:membrane-bound inhibitor of C-type lysozyme